MRPNTCRCLVTCPTLCACLSCRNLVAMCLVFCYQKHLSLRTQVVNPLVLVFIVLASTAALVSGLEGKAGGYAHTGTSKGVLKGHRCFGTVG